MKTITQKQFEALCKIEDNARHTSYSFTERDYMNETSVRQIKLEKYRRRWEKLSERLGILDYQVVRYKVENGKDYSHGYTFGDCLA